MKKIFTNASDTDLKTLAYVLNEKGTDFGIDSKEKLQHFLAQAAHETGGFKKLGSEENLNYTTKARLLNIFKKYFSETDTIKKRKPDDYVKNPKKLGNYVYGGRLGNGKESTGDGYKYRGRGIFQLTGKTNYANFKTWYNAKYDPDKDFVKSPDVLKDNDTIAILSALWFYKINVIDKVVIDSATTVKKVTKKVNGGYNGMDDRKKHFKKAKDSITCK
ncbi:MAG: glycoside hydrolase family 19 protein [Jejuia sp.]